MKLEFRRAWAPACALAALLGAGCPKEDTQIADSGGGRKPADFPELASDVFHEMDGGMALATDEVKGRNTWDLWCGGDEQFWNRMSQESYGLIDLLKTIDSRNRATRFKDLGLINEPGYRQATKPDEYGLYIDEPVEGQGESKDIDPNVYGRSTGVMGFRLFPNPDFNEEAKKKWDGARYNSDRDYAVQPDLIRPYRVGISCGSCHIAFNPVKPPDDPENPKFENLMSVIGNQYIREGVVFANNVRPGGFFWEMLKTQPPGTSDTSRIATDHINNPNVINPIFLLGSRLSVAHTENISGDTLLLPGETNPMPVPHILKDGADSVGVPGAALRVYINIGMYSQYWLTRHNKLIGLTPQQPFHIGVAQKNSTYWMATQGKVANVARFFTRLQPVHLEDAPGGRDYMTKDPEVLKQGKLVFAANCAQCHSSKRPPAGADADAWFAEEVLKPDFRTDNFFSDDARYSVAKIKTNAARASATNAMEGHVWNDFSSDTYKHLPSVGQIEVYNPYTGGTDKWTVPAGGPGYYRTASLISCWATAPFLHNNMLGKFTGDPSVAGRMEAFNDAVQKLLWPEKRLGKDSIWRTSEDCALQLQLAVIPPPLHDLLKPFADPDGYLRVGHIPVGTPINLIANINPEADPAKLVALCLKMKATFLKIYTEHMNDADANALMTKELVPDLLAVSKCPDFVTDRGHLFGTTLSDSEKLALIEFLKTI